MTKHLRAMALAVAMTAMPFAAFAEGKTHHIAVHVDQNDPAVINMALNNVQNLSNYYAAKGDTAVIEVVAYGPGLEMYLKDKSTVSERLAKMALEIPTLSFAACGNTLTAMSAKAGHDLALIDEAVVVPSGVVQLVTLQEEGYAYVRP